MFLKDDLYEKLRTGEYLKLKDEKGRIGPKEEFEFKTDVGRVGREGIGAHDSARLGPLTFPYLTFLPLLGG